MRDDIRFDSRVDETIERTLAGLRQVESPSGLEGRVLRTMRDRIDTAPEPVDSRGSAAWIHWAGFGLVTTAALLMVATALDRHSGGRSEHQAAVALSPAPEVVAQRNTPRSESDGTVSVRPSSHQMHRVIHEVRHQQLTSFPASEPPLSEEERLLQRIARTGDEQQIAMLNPERRAKDEAAREAAFEQFEHGSK